MFYFLPYPLKAFLSLFFLFCNILIFYIFLFPFIILKIILPITFIKDNVSKLIANVAPFWVWINFIIIQSMGKINWDIEYLTPVNFKKNKNYLVIANHQSWVDILALQKVFNLKTPFFRFFLKHSLIYFPFFGLIWWGMDYPFIKRYSKKQIEENPSLKGKNLEIAKKSCERFEKTPVSIMNFLEGTRFTSEKHTKSNSPFKYLLKPKSGGISLVLSSIPKLETILNITIIYPIKNKKINFLRFISGEYSDVIIKVEEIPVTENLIGDYANDEQFRLNFQNWSNELWYKKDMIIEDYYS